MQILLNYLSILTTEMAVNFVLIFVCVCYVSGASIEERALDTSDLPTDLTTMDLKMREAHPSKPDSYLCTGYKIEKDQYIVKFETLADAGIAHDILVFGCQEPADPKDKWQCGKVCRGQEQILFAWAKNAPPFQLPKYVGLHIGPGAGIKYIVLQVHYARVFADKDLADQSGIRIFLTQERQKFVAGIYHLLASDTTIPANTEKLHANMSCSFDGQTNIYPFAFRVHAHDLSKVILGYRFRSNGSAMISNTQWRDTYTLIGKGNPQWPQMFYPVGKKPEELEIKPGDVLAAQCTYSSIGRNRITRIGSKHNDEKCNFYIMYYMDAAMENARGSDTCLGNNEPQVSANLPAGADIPLPPNSLTKGHVDYAPDEQPSAGGPQTSEHGCPNQ